MAGELLGFEVLASGIGFSLKFGDCATSATEQRFHGSIMDTHSGGRSAIILAGGHGTRLRSLIQRFFGDDAPKQFCRVLGDTTMLEWTRRRVALAIPPAQTLIIVTKTHQNFYAQMLTEVPSGRIVVQPQDRGTAAAVLYALFRSGDLAPSASVAIFPSDHYVSDDAEFIRHLDLAFDGVRARPDLLILLGVTPDGPEVDYGWIEMGERIAQYFQLFRIGRFWQKPSPELATSLWRSGCLWDSSIVVGRISTILKLLMRALPELYASFTRIKSRLGGSSEMEALESVYANTPSVDLSHEVLVQWPELLTVLPVSGVRWSNLGEPGRLIALLREAGLHDHRE
jgi:mannose-1-phosphate guanylyltransferase